VNTDPIFLCGPVVVEHLNYSIIKEGIKYFQLWHIPSEVRSLRRGWKIWKPPRCVGLCRKPLTRWHRSCLFGCKHLAVAKGKHPQRVEVRPYMLYIHRGRPLEKVRNKILKYVLSFAELLA